MITDQQKQVEVQDVLESLRAKAKLNGTPWTGGWEIIGFPMTENEYTTAVTFDVESEKPSWGEVMMEWDNVVGVFAAEKYKYQRASAYPSIGEQLDMLYHDQLNGTTTWQDAIQAVKEEFPKPTA